MRWMAGLAGDLSTAVIGGLGFIALFGGIAFVVSRFLSPPLDDPTRAGRFVAIHPKRIFRRQEHATEAGFLFLNLILLAVGGGALIAWLATTGLGWWISDNGIAGGVDSLPVVVQVLIGLVVLDAASFLGHWFMHRYLWYYHAVHHAAREITWMTSVRLHPVGKLLFGVFGAFALHLAGLSTQAIAAAAFADAAYNLFVHMNISLEFPRPLCYLLGSPNYHRWHHASSDERAFDKNFATVFPAFDVVFGTYFHPRGRLPSAYGVYDRVGDPSLPDSFIGQLVRPFAWHAASVRSRRSDRQVAVD